MAQIDPVEVVIRARNESKAAFDEAIRQVAALQTQGARTAAVTRAGFRDLAGVVGSISPAAAQATAQVESIVGAVGGLGPAGLAVAALTADVVLLAAAYKGAFEEVRKLASSAEEIENLRQRTSLAANEVIAFRAGFEDAGVGLEAFATGMKFLNNAIASGNASLKTLGITTTDTRSALDQVADVFATLPDGPTKTRLATDLLGKSGESLIPVLNRGAAGLREFEAAATAAGITIGTGPLSRLAGLDNQFDALARSIEGVKLEIAVSLAPAIEASLPLLRSMGDAAADTVLRLEYMAAALERLKKGDLGGAIKISFNADEMVKAFAEARDAARQLAEEAGKAPPKTIIQLMAEQGRLTKSTLEGLLKLSDDVLEKLGTTRGIVKLQLETGGAESKVKKIRDEIGDLAKTMGITRDEASRLSVVLDSLGRANRAAAIRQQLDEARQGAIDVRDALLHIPLGLPSGAASREGLANNIKAAAAEAAKAAEETRKFGEEVDHLSAITGVPRIEVEGALKAKRDLDELFESFERIGRLPPVELRAQRREETTRRTIELIHDPEAIAQAKDDWMVTFEQIASGASALREEVGIAFTGVTTTFDAVTDTLIRGGNILKIRMGDIFGDIAAQAIRELNKIAAASVFKFLLRLLGGAAAAPTVGAGVAIDSPIGPSSLPLLASAGGVGAAITGTSPRRPPSSFRSAPSSSLATSRMEDLLRQLVKAVKALERQGNTTTVNVSTLDARSFRDSFESPFGSARLAFERG